MTLEKWLIHPGETRVIDIEDVRKLKIGLVRVRSTSSPTTSQAPASKSTPSRSRTSASR